MITRPAIFQWRQAEPGIILCAVRWYLGYSLSLRDVEELLEERDLNIDHTTVWQWVQYYGPALEQRLRRHLKTLGIADKCPCDVAVSSARAALVP
jgi:transposase-like protein